MRFGCDAPAPAPVFEMTCPECAGDGVSCAAAAGEDRVEKAGEMRCRGSGRVRPLRCPTALTNGRGRAAVAAVSFFEQGVLPCARGYLEQTARWRREIGIVFGEREKIENAERKQREQKKPKPGRPPTSGRARPERS